MLLAAGGAAFEVRTQAGDSGVGVLAERLSTTRGALYKTLHDARAKLRSHLEETS